MNQRTNPILYVIRAYDKKRNIMDAATSTDKDTAIAIADVLAMDHEKKLETVEVEEFESKQVVHTLAVLRADQMVAVAN